MPRIGKKKKVKISIVPRTELALGNRMFNADFMKNTHWQGNSHWMDKNIRLYQRSKEEGFELATCDIISPDQADVVIHLDLPKTRAEILEIKKKSPKAKHLLILIESPLWPYWFEKENHQDFDLILTYNPKLVDNKKHFQFYLPKSYPPKKSPLLDWEDRKPCVILNTNYYKGIKSARTPYHYLKSLYGYYRNGWCYSLKDVFEQENNLLYCERRKFVRFAQEYYPGFLDVYGKGWQGKKSGWYYRFFPDSPYVENSGTFAGEKLQLLQKYRFVMAYENFRGDIGYISEKLFDAMYAGAVPIYLGDDQISDFVDQGCFIDARSFESLKALFSYLEHYTKEQWLEKRKCIDHYLRSEKIKKFLPDAYAQTIIDAIYRLTNKKSKN